MASYIYILIFNNYSPKAKWLSVNILKTKRKSILKHEKNLFHQKRANNWQPFCSSRWLSADSLRIENQSEDAILYNHLSIYTN